MLSHYRRFRRALAVITQTTRPWRDRLDTSLAKRRRTVAVILSLFLHGLLIVLLLFDSHSNISGGGSGGASSSGLGVGSGIALELINTHQATPDAFKVKMPDPSETDNETNFTTPELRVKALETLTFDALAPQPLTLASDKAPPTTSEGGDGATTSRVDAGGSGQGGQSSGVNDALWKQIEPCWHRLANRSTRNVTLRVTFSPLGNVAQTSDAPETGATSDLKSRDEANEALLECGPYLSGSSRMDVVIAFPAPQ